MPWRANVPFIGQAYCIGGKSLYWGGWCPRLLSTDLAQWPPTVAQYLNQNYPLLEQQTGVTDDTEFIQRPLCSMSRTKRLRRSLPQKRTVPNLDSSGNRAPRRSRTITRLGAFFAFDKYSSATLLIDAVREAAGQPDDQRRLFVVPNTHVTKLNVSGGKVVSVDANSNGATRSLPIKPGCAVILAMGTIESTRLALASFPTSPGNPAAELMGRNLMAHWRSNIFVKIKRSALDPGRNIA